MTPRGALLVPARAAAQDSQYWPIQYGPVGPLVGGQVYNPGGALRSGSATTTASESD